MTREEMQSLYDNKLFKEFIKEFIEDGALHIAQMYGQVGERTREQFKERLIATSHLQGFINHKLSEEMEVVDV